MVEQGTLNPFVVGSNPSWLTGEGEERGQRGAVSGNAMRGPWRRRRRLTFAQLRDGHRIALGAAGRTADTIAWYDVRLARFEGFLPHDAPADQIRSETVRLFLLAVKRGRKRLVSDGYVESHRRALAGCFSWALQDGHLEESPLEHVRRVKCDTPEINVLEPHQVLQLMATQPRSTYEGLRNRTMMATLYDTGVRVGELVTIDLDDVDLVGSTIRVRGKGRTERRVPISPTLRAALWTYVERIRPTSPTSRLFLSAEGEPLSENSINQWLRRAARAAKITGVRVSPHTFRSSFATQFLRNGGGELALQRILGHSTLDMVRRYVRMAATDVASRHAIASPLEHMGRGA